MPRLKGHCTDRGYAQDVAQWGKISNPAGPRMLASPIRALRGRFCVHSYRLCDPESCRLIIPFRLGTLEVGRVFFLALSFPISPFAPRGPGWFVYLYFEEAGLFLLLMLVPLLIDIDINMD
ncbi:hypothetical protein BJX62DRAFT_94482 [Aspergillus germanicus]